jgi:hypothetical protein
VSDLINIFPDVCSRHWRKSWTFLVTIVSHLVNVKVQKYWPPHRIVHCHLSVVGTFFQFPYIASILSDVDTESSAVQNHSEFYTTFHFPLDVFIAARWYHLLRHFVCLWSGVSFLWTVTSILLITAQCDVSEPIKSEMYHFSGRLYKPSAYHNYSISSSLASSDACTNPINCVCYSTSNTSNIRANEGLSFLDRVW